MSRRALIIGINYKGSNYELYGCINDASKVANRLRQGGWNRVFLMEDTLPKSSALYPSKKNILAQLTALGKETEEKDYIFIGYMGHGGQTLDTSGDEASHQDDIIYPADYPRNGAIIKDDELHQVLSGYHPQSLVFCLFDCCHSGTVLDLPYMVKSDSKKPHEFHLVHNITGSEPVITATVVCLSGCQDDQTSMELPEQGTDDGALTALFLEEYRKKGTALTFLNLIGQIQSRMLKLIGRKQLPQMSLSRAVGLESVLCLDCASSIDIILAAQSRKN